MTAPTGETSPHRRTGSRSAHGDARRPTHLPQLDGLRTVAVTLVLVYHVARTQDTDVLPGGFVGVDLFFVLSGFLITSLLLREHRATGRISFQDFYRRRIRRILPASVLVLVVTVVVARTVFFANRARETADDALWALLNSAEFMFNH